MKTITLNADEIAGLMQPTSGQGGWQSLIEGLQAKLDASTGAITLTDKDLERIPRYAFDYGNGGWEGKLQTVFRRHLGTDLKGP